MFNFGFKYAMKDNPNWNCLILHDGDMMPMNMSAAYECREKVTFWGGWSVSGVVSPLAKFPFFLSMPVDSTP